MFSVICYDSLLPNVIESPASYTPLPTKDLQRDSTVEDICDFIVEYIHSDLLVRVHGHPRLRLDSQLFELVGFVINQIACNSG